MDVVCPISVTLFFLVLLLLLTQSLDMIDDEVSYLWGMCGALFGLNLLFSPYNTTRTLCEGGKITLPYILGRGVPGSRG